MADNNTKTLRLNQRWGSLLEGGFLTIPVLLLKRQAELKLRDGELLTLLHLLSAWWEAEDYPSLGPARIARHLGTSPRTVQRHLQNLVHKGLIKPVRGALKSNPDKEITCYNPEATIRVLHSMDVARPRRIRSGMPDAATAGVVQ